MNLQALITHGNSNYNPSGTIQLLDGGNLVATIDASAVWFRVTFTGTGTHALTAVYAGDNNFLGSTSAVVTQVVKYSSTVGITSTPNPAAFGAMVTFTATVSPSLATGTVDFVEYVTPYNPVTLSTVTLVNGKAVFTTSALAAGSHSIVAKYGGDANYSGSSSNTAFQSINPAPPTGTGLIATIAGTGVAGTGGTGGPAPSAQLTTPTGMCTDRAGNLFISDAGNNRVVRVDTAGILTLAAGNGAAASGGDGGPAVQASINDPVGVAVDAAGNLYISEYRGHRIRRVDALTGSITTFAGTGTRAWSGDGGPAVNAGIDGPAGIAFDSAGNLYVTDSGNFRIRRIDAISGIISTAAGNGVNAYVADGVPAAGASLSWPQWVSFDGTGNLLISETRPTRIRRVDRTTGILGTVAGNGASEFNGDGIAATGASLGLLVANVATDTAGNLLFADMNGRIRSVIDICIKNAIIAAKPTPMPRLKGSADLLEDRRQRALALLKAGLTSFTSRTSAKRKSVSFSAI